MSETQRPHVVVINRWQERYAHYDAYLDHDTHAVTYVSTKVGTASIPDGAAAVELVAATDDLPSVRDAVRGLAARFGRPTAVLALKEDDLLVGAELRAEWDCPGQRPQELVVLQDKVHMATAIVEAGLPVPAFAAVADARAVSDFAAVHGWPVVVKPRVGSSSAGVVLLAGPDDLGAVDFASGPMLVQAYCGDPIHHVDGLFDGRDVSIARVARYLDTCLNFRSGATLGSVEVDDPAVVERVTAAAKRFLAALTGTPVVFHLEVFVGADGCSFLEIGARTGGAEIPFLWREIHGYDLMGAAAAIQLGRPAPPPPPTPSGEVGGWLLVPAPAERPCRITASASMLGADPGPYAEVVLKPGQVLPLADAYYEHVGGRFRFRGTSSAEITAAIAATAARYLVSAEPIRPEVPKDYSVAVLDGPGDNDYARYMRTDTLLSLQRDGEEVVHRDELLFQTVHQSTELWLKLACHEVREAGVQVEKGSYDTAARLLARASVSARLITGQLEMIRHLTPWSFQTIRTVLGHGSGFESPGWRSVQRVNRQLCEIFDRLVSDNGIDLAELYRGDPDTPLYRLAEAMIDWDDRIAVWRTQHYKIATRIIGHQVVGTKGAPVDVLARLIGHKFFPELWRVRTALTQTGPMAGACPVDMDSELVRATAGAGS